MSPENKDSETSFVKEHYSLFNLSRMINAERDLNVLHGTENSIADIEKSSNRKNVTVKGTLEGNKRGWILVLK